MTFIIIIMNCLLVFKPGLRPLEIVQLVLKADILLLTVEEDVVGLNLSDGLVHHNC